MGPATVSRPGNSLTMAVAISRAARALGCRSQERHHDESISLRDRSRTAQLSTRTDLRKTFISAAQLSPARGRSKGAPFPAPVKRCWGISTSPRKTAVRRSSSRLLVLRYYLALYLHGSGRARTRAGGRVKGRGRGGSLERWSTRASDRSPSACQQLLASSC